MQVGETFQLSHGGKMKICPNGQYELSWPWIYDEFSPAVYKMGEEAQGINKRRPEICNRCSRWETNDKWPNFKPFVDGICEECHESIARGKARAAGDEVEHEGD